jgi:hypothetical protein
MGFAAECAIKHHFRITVKSETPKTHLPELAASMRKRFSARDPNQATMYKVLEACSASFADWTVSSRYSASGDVTTAQYTKWRAVARRILGAARLRPSNNGG